LVTVSVGIIILIILALVLNHRDQRWRPDFLDDKRQGLHEDPSVSATASARGVRSVSVIGVGLCEQEWADGQGDSGPEESTAALPHHSWLRAPH
jgi:hypothetical protein